MVVTNGGIEVFHRELKRRCVRAHPPTKELQKILLDFDRERQKICWTRVIPHRGSMGLRRAAFTTFGEVIKERLQEFVQRVDANGKRVRVSCVAILEDIKKENEERMKRGFDLEKTEDLTSALLEEDEKVDDAKVCNEELLFVPSSGRYLAADLLDKALPEDQVKWVDDLKKLRRGLKNNRLNPEQTVEGSGNGRGRGNGRRRGKGRGRGGAK
jgi:hypothetical protein